MSRWLIPFEYMVMIFCSISSVRICRFSRTFGSGPAVVIWIKYFIIFLYLTSKSLAVLDWSIFYSLRLYKFSHKCQIYTKTFGYREYPHPGDKDIASFKNWLLLKFSVHKSRSLSVRSRSSYVTLGLGNVMPICQILRIGFWRNQGLSCKVVSLCMKLHERWV